MSWGLNRICWDSVELGAISNFQSVLGAAALLKVIRRGMQRH